MSALDEVLNKRKRREQEKAKARKEGKVYKDLSPLAQITEKRSSRIETGGKSDTNELTELQRKRLAKSNNAASQKSHLSLTKEQEQDLLKKQKEEETPWYKKILTKGEFDDGYQFGDLIKTQLGTSTDLVSEVAKGILSPIESVADIGANALATGANLASKVAGKGLGILDLEKTEENLRSFANNDLTETMSNIAANVNPAGMLYNVVNGTPENILNPAGISYDKDKSVIENIKTNYKNLYTDKGDPVKVPDDYEKSSLMGEYAEKVTELVGYGLSLAYGGAKLSGATKTAKVGTSTFGATANAGNIGINIAGKTLNIPTLALAAGMASGLEEANQKEDVSELERWTKALSSGAIEGITEGMFSMLKVGGITNEAGQEIFDVAASKLASNFKSQLAKTLTAVGVKATGESIEELISYGANYLVDNGIIDKLGQADFSKEWDWGEVAEQMALAFVSAGISQGGSTVIETNSAIQAAEEQLGRKLTPEEKALVTQASLEGALENKVAELEQRVTQQPTQEVQVQPTKTVEQLDNEIVELESQLNENLSDEQYNAITEQIKIRENQIEQIENGTNQISPTTTQEVETNSLVDASSNTLETGKTLQEQLESQYENITRKELAERQAMIEMFEDYVSENNITNPTEQDITNSLDSYDAYDNEMDISEVEQKYVDTIKEYLQENNKISPVKSGQQTEQLQNEGAFFNTQNEQVVEEQKTLTKRLEERVTGDDLLDAQDLIEEVKSVGANVDDNGYVTVYHATTPENAEQIKTTGKMKSKEPDVFFSTSKNAQQSEGRGGATLEFKIPAEKLILDDIFSDNADVKIPLKNFNTEALDVTEYLVDNKPTTEKSESISPVKESNLDKYLKAREEYNNNKDISKRSELIEKMNELEDKLTPEEMQTVIKLDSQALNVDQTTSNVQKELAPIKEATKELKQVQKEVKAQVKELKETMDEFKALTKEQYQEFDKMYQESLSQLDEMTSPAKEDTSPDYQYENSNEGSKSNIESPLKDRDMKEVGSRSVKAFQQERPEFKPFFKGEAQVMLNDLHNSIKGEKVWIEELNPETGLLENSMVTGTKRQTTRDIAYLLDNYNYTYAEIENGLNAIIEGKGQENIAVAKRIELMLDERLRDGYTSIDGTEIPPNPYYLRFLEDNDLKDYFTNLSQGIENTEPPIENVEQPTNNLSPVEKKNDLKDLPTAEEFANSFLGLSQQPQQPVVPMTPQGQRSYESGVSKQTKKSDKTFKEKVTGAWDTLQSHFVNRNRQQDKLAKATKNNQIKFKGDRLNNISAEIGGDIFTAQTDNYGNAIGKSLDAPFEVAREMGIGEQFDNYLKHQSNIERHARGKGSATVSAETSRQYVAAYEARFPQMVELAKDVYTYNQNLLNNAVANGLISNDFKNMLTSMYGKYVPFYETDAEATPNIDMSPDEVRTSQVVKRAKGGSNEDLLSIEQAMIKQTYSYKNAIAKNDLYKEIVKSIDDKVELGADVRENPTLMEDSLYADENGKYLTAYVNGEQKTVRISEELYTELSRDLENQIKGIEEKYSVITKPLQKISQIRGQILTTYNPSFIATNPLKDIQDALLNTKDVKGYMSHIASAVTDSTNADPKNMAEYARKFKEITGQEITSVTNKNSLPKNARKLFDFYENGLTWNRFMTMYGNNATQLEYQDTGVDTAKGSKKAKNKGFLNKLGNANNFMEVMFRYPEFKATLKKGKSVNEALYNAREVTTNFGRGGTISKAINRNGATFYNTSIQGLDKFVRNFSGENGARAFVGTVGKAFAIGMLPAILNHLFLGDDEEYEALPDYIKDNYYLFKTGEGEFIRIPKGRMISVLGSAARRSLELASGEEDAFEGYLKNASSQVGSTNPLKENILSPIIQAATNEAWYGGDLVPKRLQDKPAEEQYDETTDEFSKWVGGKLKISPYKINYVIDQYSGGIGDIALPLMTKEATSDAEGLGNLIAPVKDKFVVNSTSDNKYVGDLYDTSDKLTKKANASNATTEDVLKSKYINSVKADLNELYTERREIQNDPTLTKAEKYEKVKEIQNEINNIAKLGLENYEDISTHNNYSRVGEKEYYLNTKNEWQKVDDDELEELNSMGMTESEKNSYFFSKNEISRIANDYKEDKEDLNEQYGSDEEALKGEIETLSEEKQKDIILKIKSSGLTEDQKTYLYSKYYSSEKALNNITSQGVSIDTYLSYKYNTIEFEGDKDEDGDTINGSLTKKKIEYLMTSSMSENDIQVLYENEVLGDFDNDKKHKGYKAAKAVGVDINSWLNYSTQEFEADYNEKGNAIRNSKRNKVINYVNTLPLDIPQKAAIIRTQYPSFDEYNNDIVYYVDSLSITREEKVQILENLDMRVEEDGTVRWD